MAETDSLELKKRARRRLVGSAALALLAAIVLPMAMDREPANLQQDVQIHIPQQGGGPYADKPQAQRDVLPEGEAEPDAPSPAEVAGDTVAQPEPPVVKPAPPVQPPKPVLPKPVPKADPKPADAEGARARALLEGQAPPLAATSSAFVVQLGAYRDVANAQSVRDRARAAGFSAYTENLEGTQRVRVGPFASREAADATAERLRRQGFPSVVTPR